MHHVLEQEYSGMKCFPAQKAINKLAHSRQNLNVKECYCPEITSALYSFTHFWKQL
jgi:hypothetical protein